MEHVSYEQLCPGIGLGNIYSFLKEGVRLPEPSWLSEEISSEDNPVPVIFRNVSKASLLRNLPENV